MISVGAGVVLLVLLTVAMFFSEKMWLRIVCGAYVAIFIVATVGRVIMWDQPAATLLVPGILTLFALYVLEVKKGTPEV